MSYSRCFTVISMVLVLSLVSCATDKSDGTLIRPVKTGRVEMSVPMERTSLSGTVSAGMEAHPSFRRTGVIKSIYVREGEHVEKGQLLAELDTRDIEEASEAAKSKYEQVAAEVGRVEELYKRKSVAKNEYEKAISGLQTVTSLYETTQNQLADSKLYAPISGTVQTVSYAPNMTVTPVSGVVSIINTNELQIEGYISSSLFVKRDRFVRMVAYSAIMKDSIPLDISYISPKANNSQLYKVRFDLAPEYSRRLAPGMVVEISLYYRPASDADVMTVPMSSVFSHEGQPSVWCVDTATMTVGRKEIATAGLSEDGNVVVTGGLAGDEILVTAGVSMLREGDKVRLSSPIME